MAGVAALGAFEPFFDAIFVPVIRYLEALPELVAAQYPMEVDHPGMLPGRGNKDIGPGFAERLHRLFGQSIPNPISLITRIDRNRFDVANLVAIRKLLDRFPLGNVLERLVIDRLVNEKANYLPRLLVGRHNAPIGRGGSHGFPQERRGHVTPSELGVADVDNADEILFPYLTDKITFVYFLKRYLPQKTSWFSLS